MVSWEEPHFVLVKKPPSSFPCTEHAVRLRPQAPPLSVCYSQEAQWLSWGAVQTASAAPLDTEAQMKEAAAAMKEDEEPAASADPAADVEMVRVNKPSNRTLEYYAALVSPGRLVQASTLLFCKQVCSGWATPNGYRLARLGRPCRH